jgi:hypothetical protein
MSEAEHAREPARGEFAVLIDISAIFIPRGNESSIASRLRALRYRKEEIQNCRNFDKVGATVKDGRVIRGGAEIGKSQSSVTDSCFPLPSSNEAFRYRGSVCRKIEPPPSPSALIRFAETIGSREPRWNLSGGR